MRIAIGPVVLDDGQPEPPNRSEPPAFPNGPVYVVVERRVDAAAGVEIDGRLVRIDPLRPAYRAVSIHDGAEALAGIEPSRIIWRARTVPPGREFIQTLKWRALRARIPIEDCPFT